MSDHRKWALAKTLYIHENLTAREISEKLGLNIHTVKYRIDKGSKFETPWKKIKEQSKDNALVEILEDDQVDLASIYSLGLSVVQRSLAKIELTEETLSVGGNLSEQLFWL